jgi:diphthine-ammonia ligase
MNRNTLCSWSGGKDSCYALMLAVQQGYVPKVLLSVLNEQGKISRSHGIPQQILEAQAKAASLPIETIASSWADYEKKFIAGLQKLKDGYETEHAVFGDIDFEAHRQWEEKVCHLAGLQVVLPLWKQDRKELVLKMLNTGMQTMIVSCNDTMGEKYLGQLLTAQLIDELEKMGIDACGENGEYHTLVLDCALFENAIQVKVTEKLHHENYWFCGLELDNM